MPAVVNAGAATPRDGVGRRLGSAWFGVAPVGVSREPVRVSQAWSMKTKRRG
jgi:hypothetical protein